MITLDPSARADLSKLSSDTDDMTVKKVIMAIAERLGGEWNDWVTWSEEGAAPGDLLFRYATASDFSAYLCLVKFAFGAFWEEQNNPDALKSIVDAFNDSLSALELLEADSDKSRAANASNRAHNAVVTVFLAAGKRHWKHAFVWLAAARAGDRFDLVKQAVAAALTEFEREELLESLKSSALTVDSKP